MLTFSYLNKSIKYCFNAVLLNTVYIVTSLFEFTAD